LKQYKRNSKRETKTDMAMPEILDHYFPRKPLDTPMCRKPRVSTSIEHEQQEPVPDAVRESVKSVKVKSENLRPKPNSTRSPPVKVSQPLIKAC